MPIPFLNSITLNKNEIQEFKVYNLTPDPTLTSAGDYGYMWLNTSDSPKTLKWWDGTSIRSIVDSGNTSTLTVGTANDLSGGVAGSLPYQQGVGDTTFLGIGSSGYILTSTGSAPQWSASIPSSSVSGLAASATTDTTNASNISSGTLGLARLSLATGQFYVGDGSNNPAATAKSSIPLSGFGAAGADVAMGGFKITGLADPAAATDAATRGYVDSVAQGLDVKASCLVATTADITLASPGAVTIDGIYSATDFTAGTTRILVKDQSAPAENGIYIWQGPAAAMTRSADADTWDELVGAFTFIERGTANADSGWVCTVNAGGTLGTTAVTWVKFSQAGSYTQGRGMVLDGTAFNFAQSTNYTTNTIPYASGATTIGFISAGTADQVLRVPGAGGTPAFGAIDLTKSAAVTGALPIANGGTGATSFTQGQVLFAGASTISSSANLFWDNSNNRLGIGTATPTTPLDILSTVVGNSNAITIGNNEYGAATYLSSNSVSLTFNRGTSFQTGRIVSSNSINGNLSEGYLAFQTSTSNVLAEHLRIASDGVCTWSNVGGVAGTAMTLNGTGLGIGVSPSYKLDVNSSTLSGQLRIFGSNQNSITIGNAAGTSGNGFLLGRSYTSNNANDFFIFDLTASAPRFAIDSSGNVGIGTTSPVSRLHVDKNSAAVNYVSVGNNNNGIQVGVKADGTPVIQNYAGVGMVFGGNGSTTPTTQMVLDASGNLGLANVIPSSWLYNGFSVGSGTGNFGVTIYSGTSNNGILAFADGSSSTARYSGYIQYAHGNDSMEFATQSTGRLSIKSTGQVNFVGLSSDPAGAAGDVVYNSTSNRLKYHNGTAWVNTGTNKYSGALTGTGTSFTVTHNLGTRDVTVAVRKSGSTYDQVFTDVQMTDTNTVTIVFASSVTGSDYTVTVIG